MATIRTNCPKAAVRADPFHVIKLAGDALDELRRANWQQLRETGLGSSHFLPIAGWGKRCY